ncbi:protein of unknown function [Streptomyces sp. KY75]|nr:protein of unknown function [Streptomyces sp. KY75]CAD5982462.1 protein of unknown function [Streptomyces sp. KY70]
MSVTIREPGSRVQAASGNGRFMVDRRRVRIGSGPPLSGGPRRKRRELAQWWGERLRFPERCAEREAVSGSAAREEECA